MSNREEVGDKRKPGVVPLQSETPVKEAGEKLRALGAGTFPVAEDEKLVGQVLQATVDSEAARHGHDPSSTKVGECMVKEAVYCFEHQGVEEVKHLMQEKQLSHIPVVGEDLRVIGIVSLRDLELPSRSCAKSDLSPGSR